MLKQLLRILSSLVYLQREHLFNVFFCDGPACVNLALVNHHFILLNLHSRHELTGVFPDDFSQLWKVLQFQTRVTFRDKLCFLGQESPSICARSDGVVLAAGGRPQTIITAHFTARLFGRVSSSF